MLRREDYKPPNFRIPHATLRLVVNSVNDAIAQIDFRVLGKEPGEAPPRDIHFDCDPELTTCSDLALVQRLAGNDSITTINSSMSAVDGDHYIFTTQVDPQSNTSSKGLYADEDGNMFTLFEPDEFQRLVPWPDRPDVLSTWRYEIEADKKDFPVVLAGGTLVSCEEIDGGKTRWIYDNDTPTPCYLLAVVLGKFDKLEDVFTYPDGREVKLELYTAPGKQKTGMVALQSLKQFLEWDERRFGLQVTDPEYRIAVAPLMSAGAMETHRLNVFNEKYGTFDPRQQTDFDRRNVERVVTHEGGHYQTGNSVTIEDFFNVMLKEGITTLREQMFMEENGAAAYEKISRVRSLQGSVFPKDDSPTSKPLYPQEAAKLDNLYNLLAYVKGAEVGRMLGTLMGDEVFCKAMNAFITKHKGTAANIDQFMEVMAEVSGINLKQFRETWFDQEGVAHCDIDSQYDEQSGTFTVRVKQQPAKQGQKPYQFPLSMALFDKDGKEIQLQLAHESVNGQHDLTRGMLQITESEQVFVFKNIKQRPVPSYFRNYSAPMTYDSRQTNEEALFLAQHENDTINRFMAVQKIQMNLLNRIMAGQTSLESSDLVVYKEALPLLESDPGLFIELMKVPDVAVIAQQMNPQDYMKAHRARIFLQERIAQEFGDVFESYIARVQDEPNYDDPNDISTYKSDAASTVRRGALNLCRKYCSLNRSARDSNQADARKVFKKADNMTEKEMALSLLITDCAQRGVDGFREDSELMNAYEECRGERLMFQKLLTLVGTVTEQGIFNLMQQAMSWPEYDVKLPNNIFSLWFGFMANPYFHAPDGSGYTLLADEILKVDSVNQTVSARLADGFVSCEKLAPSQSELMRKQIERILSRVPSVSDTVKEKLLPFMKKAETESVAD